MPEGKNMNSLLKQYVYNKKIHKLLAADFKKWKRNCRKAHTKDIEQSFIVSRPTW